MAYCTVDDIQAWNCDGCDQSFSPPTVFQTTDSEALVSYVTDNGEDTIIAVFEGTDPTDWSDWVTDLTTDFVDSNMCSGCRVHEGFHNAYKSERDNVDTAVSAARARLPSATVVVVGHSLGAAIGQLYSVHLYNDLSITPVVYTFGNPRVGNQAFSSYYNSIIPNSYRTNNNRDIVPHLPPNAFGFVHSGTLVFCTDDTNCSVKPGAENDGGLFHTSVSDHGHYLGIDYFNFGSTGDMSGCTPS